MIVHFIKKVVLLIVIIMFYGTSIFSQSVTQKFYKDSYLYKEVEESKAKFVKTITENQDESITYEVKEIKTNKFIKRYSYKEFEPVGLLKTKN